MSFESEDNSKHWSKTFRYDEAVLDYLISNENYFEEMDDHTLYEYKSYTGGQLHYWNRHFQQLDEHGEVVYSVTHYLNDTKDGLVPSIAVHLLKPTILLRRKGTTTKTANGCSTLIPVLMIILLCSSKGR